MKGWFFIVQRKKILSLIMTSVILVQCFSGCKKTEKLKNHMTEKELSSIEEGPLTILDEPWKTASKNGSKQDPYGEGVYLEIWEKEDMLTHMKEHPELYSDWTEEEKEEYKETFQPYVNGYIVDGRNYGCMVAICLDKEDSYGWYYVLENGALESRRIQDYEDLKKILPDLMKEYQKKEYENAYISDHFDPKLAEEDILRAFSSLDEKTYQELPIGTTNERRAETMIRDREESDEKAWDFEKELVSPFRDQIREYHFYDEELDRKFVVHVALPKGSENADKALPALLLTDAVWRFNDIASLLSEMEEGRAQPQILISVGQDYSICNSDNEERSAIFCEGKEKFLDFLTDNLMPYLGEKYKIDYGRSTLFGHSLGGVFAHYALFKSDSYSNQPFGAYIIGSPAFWSPYSRNMGDYTDLLSDYGYFDRNKKIGKKVYITAGNQEDEDYAEYFEDGDSTTESVRHLQERINFHCEEGSPMAVIKLYESHHYQYVQQMLIEYVDGNISSSETQESSSVPAPTYEYKYQMYATMTPEEIVSTLTLEQKVAQMVQPIHYALLTDEEEPIKKYGYGSIYADEGAATAEEWRELLDSFQKQAIESEAGIPYLVAQDDVHGVGYCINSVIFPHNIGVGAANDEELAYQLGRITADEAKLCHNLWNLYPCVAQSNDPRWGRNYECYSSDLDIITRMSTAYTKGLVDGGVIATAKHYFGDGNVKYGTGEQSDYPRIIDRGDARLSEEQINELLKVYQAQIDAGAKVVMVSYSSLNGTKMHENGDYIWKLKDEMGLEGFVMSDSMAIQNTSPETFDEQVISAINCGIDLLMEGLRYDDARRIIIDAVNSGKITMERIDDAVTRIIKVKKEAGVFDDPFCENIKTEQEDVGSPEYRAVAEKLVEKSLVLLKNENNTLPLKEGTKVYVMGPAANNPRAQCGGWTMGWNQSPTKNIAGVTTILEAFVRYAKDYGIEVITDSKEAENADVVLLCVGEDAYAEWFGDTDDLDLCGMKGLSDNRNSIDKARALGKPTVTCIVAGRNVLYNRTDYESWDSVVMCYLPGSEGKGISDVLCGCADFIGRLPEPWYGARGKIGTDEYLFELGYGLSYGEGFTPKTEPSYIPDPEVSEVDPAMFGSPMVGTNYQPGVYSEEENMYINEYADFKIHLPDGFEKADDSFMEMAMADDLEECSTEKDTVRLSSMIMDSYFGADGPGIEILFLNRKLASPEDPDYTAEEYLDDTREYTTGVVRKFGITPTYEERTKVTIGGKEYVREICTMSGLLYYWYAREVDDDVICVIWFITDSFSPAYCEKLIE